MLVRSTRELERLQARQQAGWPPSRQRALDEVKKAMQDHMWV